jgi:hypothetical protein
MSRKKISENSILFNFQKKILETLKLKIDIDRPFFALTFLIVTYVKFYGLLLGKNGASLGVLIPKF